MVRRRQSLNRSAALAWTVALIAVVALGLWLARHPQHNPWAALDLADPVGMATVRKLSGLVDGGARCQQMLRDADIAFEAVAPAGSGRCRAEGRTQMDASALGGVTLSPAGAAPRCVISLSLHLWVRDVVQPAAMRHLGRQVVGIDHLGSYNCRVIAGTDRQSEHATANAIDIAAFILNDGRRVTVRDHWDARDGRSAFLRGVRDGGCDVFATVLSPDYNRAHADHLHLDQARRVAGWSVCR